MKVTFERPVDLALFVFKQGVVESLNPAILQKLGGGTTFYCNGKALKEERGTANGESFKAQTFKMENL